MSKGNRNHSTYGTINYTTEEGTKNSLVQFIIFSIYLICLTLSSKGLTTHQQHYFNLGMLKSFKRTFYMPGNVVISFDKVITIPDFWNYIEYAVIPMLHGVVFDETVDWKPHWVTNRPNLYGRLFLNESVLLQPPRLRQIRVRNDTCFKHIAFERYSATCMAAYSSDAESKEPFYKGTEFKTMKQLKVSPIRGVVHTYASGGYVQQLSFKKDVNVGVIRHLKNIKWLDRASRLVVFELKLINLNLDLLQSIKIIFEIMPTGLINHLYRSRCHYTDLMPPASRSLILPCASVVYIINFYYTFVEIKILYLNGWRHYFKKLSIFLILPRIFIVHTSLMYSIYIFFYYERFRDADRYFDALDYVNYTYSLHRDSIGILLFFSWISLLKFMDFNPVLRTMGLAMHIASRDLGAFAIMFLIAFVAFANLGLLLFGGENVNFKDFPTAFITMVRMLVSDFDYFQLEEESQILGPIFFLTYVLLIFFVSMNMFLASIVMSYKTATATIAFKPSFLLYFVRKQLYRLSNGIISAPHYPKWANKYSQNNSLDEKKLDELNIRKEYMEIESDLDVLFARLEVMQNILYRLHNNIGDIVAKTLTENKKLNKKKMQNK
ncbi:polycystic kidney disease 2-like 1 protein isoform X2 [Drosophila grimshawi]|uniref:polycystic kidney disease 2-like 1 protein isoform X2 n=1 Tax=Drosophila grimshawi TaxID=7222 RepID=UPI0013EF3E7D|nr:polycystic kidney disease 2-like 1 protein isoform X2 [Drosophila grimshawi]